MQNEPQREKTQAERKADLLAFLRGARMSHAGLLRDVLSHVEQLVSNLNVEEQRKAEAAPDVNAAPTAEDVQVSLDRDLLQEVRRVSAEIAKKHPGQRFGLSYFLLEG